MESERGGTETALKSKAASAKIVATCGGEEYAETLTRCMRLTASKFVSLHFRSFRSESLGKRWRDKYATIISRDQTYIFIYVHIYRKFARSIRNVNHGNALPFFARSNG